MEYYTPTSIQEALELYSSLYEEGKQPLYYSGGTEIITLGRLNLVQTKALIDIKAIKECQIYEYINDSLVIGAALPLTIIEEKNLFPLLSKTSIGIADHTARNKITIGGNICGQIFYREAVLPFLLTDSHAVIATANGIKEIPADQIHQLEEGQLLMQLVTEKKYINLPFISVKKRQQWETGYPLITVASIKSEGNLRFAFSGLCPFPFRSKQIETVLNQSHLPIEQRLDLVIDYIPGPVLDDIEGSKEYRLFVLRNTLEEIILQLEGNV